MKNLYATIPYFLRKLTFFILIFYGQKIFASNLKFEMFTEDELRYIAEHPVIRVSNEMDYIPYDYAAGGEACGYSVDLVKMIAERAGLKVEFVNGYRWRELIELFKEKKIDLMHSLTKSEDWESFGLFSEPYCLHQTHFFLLKDRQDITCIEDLYGKRVAVGDGWSVQDYLQRHHQSVKLLAFNNIQEMLDALIREEVDVVLSGRHSTDFFIQKHNYRGIKTSGVFHEFDKFGVQKFHFMGQKDCPYLISIFNKVFRKLSANDLESLKNKWLEPTSRSDSEDHKIELNYEEREYLEQKGVLTYCIDPDWMPYEKVNHKGVHIGISADYMTLFSERLGVEFELYKSSNWSESLINLKHAVCDLVPMLTPTDERKAQFDLTTSYINFPTVIVTREDHLIKDSLAAISDQTFVCMEDFAASTPIMAKYSGLNLQRVGSVGEGLMRVKQGEVFGYIDLSATVMYAMRVNSITGLKISYEIPDAGGNALASRKDEPVLGNILQKAVDSLTEEDHRRISNKWLAVTVNQVVDYALIWWIIGTVSIILIVFVYWNRKLKLAKKEVEAALKSEKEAVQQNLNFIDMISHEYRTPLSIINSCLDVVERKYTLEKFPGLEEQVQSIREASQRLLTVFESSLNQDKRGAHDSSVRQEQVKISEVVRSAVSFVQCAYPNHSVLLDNKANSLQVFGDGSLIVTAVSNILDNACKYSNEGCFVKVKVARQAGMCVITVKDQGIGIGDAEVGSVFEKYYRSQCVGDKRGAGVGLFLVKKVIDIHNGKLSVESTLGQGSLFTIEIPLIQSQGAKDERM